MMVTQERRFAEKRVTQGVTKVTDSSCDETGVKKFSRRASLPGWQDICIWLLK